MAKNEGSHAWLYVGLGVVAAAGAGYLAWRYLLDESTTETIRNTTKEAVTRGKAMADEASQVAMETGRQASRDVVTRIRTP